MIKNKTSRLPSVYLLLPVVLLLVAGIPSARAGGPPAPEIKLPESYSEAGLNEKLAKMLPPDDLMLVVNPLAITPEMSAWAHQLTIGATNDEARARLLFAAFVARERETKPVLRGVPRTARDVFMAWNNPDISFSCRDNALLYVALARSVGLAAFDVYVQKAVDDSSEPHDCAFVRFQNYGILVDPAFFYYGVPHKQFIVLDDLQVIALYLDQLPGLRCAKIASQLAPELPLVQLNYFENLVNAGLLTAARTLLPRIQKLDINPATTAYAEGSVAMLEGQTSKAIALLRKAIAEDPNEGVYYYRLAFTYAQNGDLPQARESLKSALACRLMDSEAAEMNKLITNTNAMPVWVNMNRGFTMLDQTNVPEAIKSFEKVTMIEPANENAFRELGYLYFNRLDFAKALNAFNHVSKLDTTDPYAHFHIWLLRSRLGETTEATQELLMFMTQQAPRPTNDWPSHIGRFLAGQENEKQLIGPAEGMNVSLQNGYNCEAHFYAGEKRLLSGDRAGAEKEFKACIATGANDQTEFAAAKAELQALMNPTNKLPAPIMTPIVPIKN